MAINKKLIHFKTKQKFNEELANGNILETSIVFILDTKEIYTHGLFYDGKLVDLSNIETSILNILDNYATKEEIPNAVTESTVSGWGFTKNTGTYSKPSGGIPKSDLASAVQTSLGKADTALLSYTEQYKGTVTGVKVNGSTKSPSSGTVDIGNVVTSIKINGSTKSPVSGALDLGTVITSHQDISGKQDKLVSGTNIKTINGNSILGNGDLVIEGTGGGGDLNVQPDWNETDTTSDAYIKNKPTIPSESTVSGWGFTKNTGTVTGVKVNGSTKNPSSGIVDLGTVITTIDSSMSSTSTNPVLNKVIKSYIDSNCNIPTETTTVSSKLLTANKYCRWTNTPTSITITLATPSNTSIVNNYMFEFTASSSGCTLSVPSTIKWINGTAPSIEAGKTYQISIINNLATIAKFS